MENERRKQQRLTRLVVASYVLLALTPFVVAGTRASFWDGRHSLAPIATVAFGLLLVGLVLRQRWAWGMPVVFEAAVLIGIAADAINVILTVANVAGFALLVSGPMRRFVGDSRSSERPAA